jgi:lipopolysaccharide/colanic/teichoic acid biosynthesis glycosyltransferase
MEDPLYRERYRVRPGITGLAQVSGTYATTAPLKLRFDLMYIHHQSLSLDLRILMRTVKVVLTGRGAV